MAALAIGALFGVVGAVQQRKQQKKAEKAQEKAARVANAQANLRRQREIRQRVAQSRVQQAEIQAAGFSSGSPNSSIVQGAQAGIQTDTASAVGFSNQMFGLEQQRVGFLNQAARAQSSANMWGTIGGVGQSVAGMFAPQA